MTWLGERVGRHRDWKRISVVSLALGGSLVFLLQFIAAKALDLSLEPLINPPKVAVYFREPPQSAGPFAAYLPGRSPSSIEGLQVSGYDSAGVANALARKGGIPVETAAVDVLVQGSGDHAFALEGAEAVAVDCRPTESGTWVVAYGAGPLPERRATIDLAASDRRAQPAPDEDGTSWKWQRLQVSHDSMENINFYVTAPRGHQCTFGLRIDYTDQAKKRHVTVQNAGEPFQVASPRTGSPTLKWVATERGVALQR